MADEVIIKEIMERAQSEEGARLAAEAVARFKASSDSEKVFDLKE